MSAWIGAIWIGLTLGVGSAGSYPAPVAAEAVRLEQPFALHAGASREVRPPGVVVTLRSLADDSGCLAPDDCSAMVFRGTLVLRLGRRIELHALDTLLTSQVPYCLAFAGFELELSAVRPDTKGMPAATFRFVEAGKGEEACEEQVPPTATKREGRKTMHHLAAPQRQDGWPPQARHAAIRIIDSEGSAVEPIWIEPGSSFLSNSGWTLIFRSAEPLHSLEVKTDAIDDWMPTKSNGARFFHGGLGFFDEKATVQVRGFTADGRLLGPYDLAFDALGAVREQDMRTLRSMPATWVQFNDRNAYFTSVFSSNCGVSELRYSIDSRALDRRVSLPPCSLHQHGKIRSEDKVHLGLENTPEFIAVQLLYIDGSESPISIVRKGIH